MKRRNFMKSIVVLPFVGPLIKRVFSADAKPAPAQNDNDLLNGTVWSAPWPLCHTVIVLFADIEKLKEGQALYYLLSVPCKASDGIGTAMMICHYDEPYNGLYTEEQLRTKLSKWKRRPELELRLWNRETEELNWM